ncbi:selenium metabolism-associated LysR family transcriptional regulator [Ammoniphilus sp. CFH 90114]|uniref:selenium metabolism-associated LysR family transcriptional regulator n=1 Tax=Ammoniphilus sp. CFH 90114 TaxID=2493665 RepID=UPI00100E1C83|nr:selenium metabolism-associated LysR family transcriptional regulator [Ammoniphilus sp. CFH 90114]RXT07204.1 LysR family transcriptional regulator [Ammoniphilus sp. CFH 90114]
MNFEHLKVFYVAATKKNFSETAKTLHLSQPTVSLQIQQLESLLNVKLFERTTKNIKLTDSGQLLYLYAGKIINLVNQTKKELDLLSSSIHGNLSIGASLTIGEYLLPYIIGKYQKEYPKVHLSMNIYNSSQIIQQLKNEQIDLGFIESTITDPELVYLPFSEDQLILISSAKDPHPMVKDRESILPSELFSLPLIVREHGSGTRQVMEESLLKHNLDPSKLNIILELGSTESIKATVESGMGLSIISESAIQKELRLGTLRTIRIQGISLLRNFSAIFVKNKLYSVPADSFLEFILKQYNATSTETIPLKREVT